MTQSSQRDIFILCILLIILECVRIGEYLIPFYFGNENGVITTPFFSVGVFLLYCITVGALILFLLRVLSRRFLEKTTLLEMRTIYSSAEQLIILSVIFLTFIIPLLFYGYLGVYNRFVADDYCLAAIAKSDGVWKGGLSWYTNWTGRYSFNFIKTQIQR